MLGAEEIKKEILKRIEVYVKEYVESPKFEEAMNKLKEDIKSELLKQIDKISTEV